jgi:hypothetical protein
MKTFNAIFWIMCVMSALFSACSKDVAGGVTEETNSIAGVIYNSDQKVASGVEVLARSVADTTRLYKDTTDSQGSFAFKFKEEGLYGVSAKTSDLAYYELVEYKGATLNVEASLKKFTSFSGKLTLSGVDYNEPIQVFIPGSPWAVYTNENLEFEMDSVPEGAYYVYVRSPDQSRFNDAYFWVSLLPDTLKGSQGPLPTSLATQAPSDDKNSVYEEADNSPFNFNWTIPMSSEYGLVGWWPMNYISKDSSSIQYISDARGRTDVGVVYGKTFLDSGVLGQSLVLRGSNDFVVIESDRGVLDSATALTLEAWIYIEDLNETEDVTNYRKNLIGKVGFGNSDDRSVFSLAIIKNECEVEGSPVLAFFIADGSGTSLDCANAVVDPNAIKVGEWLYTTSVWNGQTLSLYVNGAFVASRGVSVDVLTPSIESLYFGKENLNFRLDEVRWSTVAISASDVLYRYYNQGGVQ